METSALTGELSNSKVAAVFDDAGKAREAAEAVGAALGLGAAQVQVVVPGEPAVERKLEPESRGIWRTIVIAHMRLGVIGAIAGLLVFAVLYAMGVPFVVSTPWGAALVLLFFGAVGGLFLGGLLSLRPDHDRYVEATRAAMEAGRTTVVVHAFSAGQRDAAAAFLKERGGNVTTTL